MTQENSGVIVGLSGDGPRARVLCDLVAALGAKGLVTAVLLEEDSGFDLDRQGKDSYLHRQAGAQEVALSSTHRWALMHEGPADQPPGPAQLLQAMGPRDILLVDGFAGWPMDRILVLAEDQASVPAGGEVIAVAGSASYKVSSSSQNQPRQFAHGDGAALADFLVRHFNLSRIEGR